MRRKFSRLRFYFINIFLGLVIVSVVSVLLVASFCKTDSVTMEGTDIYTTEEMETYVLTGDYADNAVAAVLMNLFRPPGDIPFIQKVSLRLDSYHSLHMVVQEKDMIGYIALAEGGYAYFDREGNVVEVSERILPDQIPVGGVLVEEAQIDQKVDLGEAQLTFLTSLLKTLEKYEIAISEADFDADGSISVVQGGICIDLGKVTDLEEKVMRLPHILPQLEGQSGTLHLENWSEDNTDVVFDKQT